MRRQPNVLLTMSGVILGAALAFAGPAPADLPQATLKGVTVLDPSSGDKLLLQMEGQCPFTTQQGTNHTLFIDLKGAKLADTPTNAKWSQGLVAGYELSSYKDNSGQWVLRVQLQTRDHAPYHVRWENAGLRVAFDRTPAPASGVAPASPAETPKSALPATTGAGARLIRVSGVKIESSQAGETFVDVATSIPATYHVLQLEHPRRLVVDLDGAQKATGRRSYTADSGLLKGVRVAQFQDSNPAVVRIVADLSGDPAFDVYAIPGGVRIELKPRELAHAVPVSAPKSEEPVTVAEAAPTPAPAATAEPPAPAPSSTASDPPAEQVTARAATPAPAPVTEAPKPSYPDVLPVASNSAKLTAALRPSVPNQTPEALRAEKAMKVLSNDMRAEAAQEQQPPAAPEQPATPPPANPPVQATQVAMGSEQPRYTGEPISLNLKDVDLKDFFRLIHEISGLNIIVDPNVGGSVTLVLESVPWDQALDIVLKNNHLGKTLEGNVLRIARVETLTAEQQEATKLADARVEALPLVTVFRPINYAKATTLQTMLKSWAGGGALSKRGTVLVDDRTNTLIISDVQTQIPIIENIISKIDKKAKQVAIEARIVLASTSFSRNLSAALNGGWFNRATITGAATGTAAQASTDVPPAQITLTPASASGFGAFAVTNIGARYFINAAISAAETRSQAKTISRPTVVTQNNVPGTVVQGTQIPIQTTINNTISIQYQQASLTLTVTPQVTDDGNVFMIINVTNASPGAVLTSAGPSINNQSATTQVLVPDGGTVVFGGVTVTSRSKSATYVPLLGSIPVIGHLFKTSNVQDNDQELLFFVSPKVLPT